MEENEYRRMYRAAIPSRCVFEKGILMRGCDCPLARRHNLAEREAVACAEASARRRCEGWLELLRARAVFALQLREASQVLPHAKEIRVQVGGLRGLAEAVDAACWLRDGQVVDIAGLLAEAERCYTDLAAAPFDQIVRALVRFRGRRRRR